MRDRYVILYTIFIFWILFMKSQILGINPTIYGWIKNAMGLALLIPLLQNFGYFINGQYKYINCSILSFGVISCISAYLNYNSVNSLNIQTWAIDGISYDLNAQEPKDVFYQMLSLVATVYLIEILSNIGKLRLMVKTLFVCMALLTFFVDIDAFGNHDVLGGNSYMIGNKFAVCYTNIYLSILYYYLNPELQGKSKYYMLLLLFLSFAICFHTLCSTALMAVGLFVFMAFLLPERIKAKLYSTRVFFVTLFICDIVFFFFTTWFLQFPVVQDFVVNVLQEDLTLTGRLGIYQNIQKAFYENPLLGFGYGNSAVISMMYTGAYDAQNGLVDMFIQVGVLGCVSFLLFMYFVYPNDKRLDVNTYPIIVFVFMILAISMVEIPFNSKFLFFSMFLLGANVKCNQIIQ